MKSKSGFTLVELIVVVVAIAILFGILSVVYMGIMSDARVAQRKDDLANLAKAIQLYRMDNGDYAKQGCGNGSGSGWLHSDYDGAGPNRPIYTCLLDGGYLTQTIVDPSGNNSCSGLNCHAYMMANCSTGVYLFANLETKPQSSTDVDETCYSSWDTSYGMNYILKVDQE
ncbi:hypothetical protein B7Y94_05315 [Candidatus Saccharibacteria bacterium 32-49-12]|nr:MAG: hypothetical protein B7Y94_05315 [Candidatus Saccharibacteria bacterium 32-49-12]